MQRNPEHFNISLLTIHLSAIKTPINFVILKFSLIGSTSLGFAQITIHDFQNTVLNSKWHCLRQVGDLNFSIICNLTRHISLFEEQLNHCRLQII